MGAAIGARRGLHPGPVAAGEVGDQARRGQPVAGRPVLGQGDGEGAAAQVSVAAAPTGRVGKHDPGQAAGGAVGPDGDLPVADVQLGDADRPVGQRRQRSPVRPVRRAHRAIRSRRAGW